MPGARLGSRKGRTLLKRLALGRGAPVPVDRLADACWADSPPANPREQVAVLASRLRRALGRDRVSHHDAGYALHADWLDVDALTQLAAEAARRIGAREYAAARAAAAAALSLVRGPLLADEADAPWADVERAATERAIARVRHLAAEAALAAADLADAAALAAAALDHDPYDEQALRLLMSAWHRAHRPASALAAYARVRARLAEDLGVDPAPETEALHTAIVRGEDLPGAPAGSGTPARPRPDVVGRDGELARFAALLDGLRPGRTELLEVEGEAGIGKTVLLAAYAAHARRAGAVVLHGACDELERSLPLQAVLDAIAARLAVAGSEERRVLLGEDAPLLAPLLRRSGSAVPAGPAAPGLANGTFGPALLYAALLAVIERIAGPSPLVLLLDDVHLAGASTLEWLRFATRRPHDRRILAVAARRPGAGPRLPATARLGLGPLALDAAEVLVGRDRAADLHRRSAGHPLFLVELAAADPDGELPASIVEAARAGCEAAGDAAETLRAAALLGAQIDLDLLSSVARRAPIEVLGHLEAGVAHRILEERGTSFVFRHDLVREALVAGTPPGRAALLHREAARALAARTGPDPLAVAYHARLGGDTAAAATALREAARRSEERFDHAAAEDLLDRSLALQPSAAGLLDRARVRMQRGRYDGAVADGRAALGAGSGAAALEVVGWATYFDRRLDAARGLADDAVRLAADDGTRARALTLAGRTRHALGDLAGAEQCLTGAIGPARGADLAVASVWLGALRAHQSRATEALDLMRPALLPGGAPGQVTPVLHALLFSAHAHALAGNPAAALDLLDRYAHEVARMHSPRAAGRDDNFRGWILRNLGAADAARASNLAALDAPPDAIVETRIAAHLDLAEDALLRDDPSGASAHLDEADRRFGPDLVFGWRLRLKARLLRGRLALATGRYDEAHHLAGSLARDAAALGVPRYAVPARLLAARALGARHAAAVDLAAVAADLGALPGAVALEAWWLTAEAARDLRVDGWWDLAERRVAALAARAGAEHRETLEKHARDRLDGLQP